ncbi:MAG: PPOX class F420-dependent oxidoreductase [Candidatus Dormibacteria bacterium]
MNPQLSGDEIALLRETQIAHLATVNPDGTPQVTPIWVDTDGECILFNTAKGRIKHRNILANPHVAISVSDRKDPYRTCIAQGTVEFLEEGAEDHIDKLAKKYLGVDKYQRQQLGEQRIIGRIHLTRIVRRV